MRHFGQGDASVELPQRARRPPVPATQHRHQRRHQERTDDGGVDEHRYGGTDAEFLMKTICEVAKAPIAIANKSAAAVTIRPVRSRPIATDSLSPAPASRASLIRESRKTP